MFCRESVRVWAWERLLGKCLLRKACDGALLRWVYWTNTYVWKKHRKNSNAVQVNHQPPMSWFKSRNFLVIVNCVTKLLSQFIHCSLCCNWSRCSHCSAKIIRWLNPWLSEWQGHILGCPGQVKKLKRLDCNVFRVVQFVQEHEVTGFLLVTMWGLRCWLSVQLLLGTWG